MDYKDYYKILGVPRNADDKAIKKAYRELARKYHPDHNQGDDKAKARFQEINEAHEVLSDPDKRSKYDQFGMDWERAQQAGGDFDWSRYASGGGPNVRYTYAGDMFGGSGGFSSFFETLFGFNDTSGQARRSRPTRGQDIEQPVKISLSEAYHGTTRILKKDGQEREIKIPAGVDSGSKIRISGEGAASSSGGASGHLYLIVDVRPDKRFERNGDDLYTSFDLPLYVAMLGGKADVMTMHGSVSLTIPPETQNGKRFRLSGKGMPNQKKPDQHGDLFATASVVLPENISDDERDLFEQLANLVR
jgi:curved DNA-binding protein